MVVEEGHRLRLHAKLLERAKIDSRIGLMSPQLVRRQRLLEELRDSKNALIPSPVQLVGVAEGCQAKTGAEFGQELGGAWIEACVPGCEGAKELVFGDPNTPSRHEPRSELLRGKSPYLEGSDVRAHDPAGPDLGLGERLVQHRTELSRTRELQEHTTQVEQEQLDLRQARLLAV
jgi:hypothetical protein